MNFTVPQRFQLLNILPQEGDIASIKIVRKLREELSFSEEEHKNLKVKYEGQMVFWDQEIAKDLIKEIDIKPLTRAWEIIIKSLQDLNSQKKLKLEYVDLYEMFIPSENS